MKLLQTHPIPPATEKKCRFSHPTFSCTAICMYRCYHVATSASPNFAITADFPPSATTAAIPSSVLNVAVALQLFPLLLLLDLLPL